MWKMVGGMFCDFVLFCTVLLFFSIVVCVVFNLLKIILGLVTIITESVTFLAILFFV